MENLVIYKTNETPEINFNVSGLLSVKGVSIPENVTKFYTPIINWLNELEQHLPNSIQLTFEIEYINTSSTRVFLEIIKRVYAFKKQREDVVITWKYEEDDEDNFDLGKDLEYSAKSVMQFEQL
jgi:SiaC family regulatory phosphoprotein